MSDISLIYKGSTFPETDIVPIKYCDAYFQLEIDLESELFYELRKKNKIKPFRLNESSKNELNEIKIFFNDNKDSFYFLFQKDEFIGSILFINNYIQSLCISKKFQRKGYATRLVKYAVNSILSKGHKKVILHVLDGNIPALNLYKKLGFEIAPL